MYITASKERGRVMLNHVVYNYVLYGNVNIVHTHISETMKIIKVCLMERHRQQRHSTASRELGKILLQCVL
jgi:hypothetical protein